MDKQNMKQNDQYKQPQQQNHNHQQQQRFPITKPGLCGTNPKFPYRDLRHYTDPCCDFPKKCQYASGEGEGGSGVEGEVGGGGEKGDASVLD